MELPSFGEFRALLQEDILFCDYLNTFLNLPVCDPHFQSGIDVMPGDSLFCCRCFPRGFGTTERGGGLK